MLLEQVPDHDALADMQVPQRIKMNASWLSQILVGALGEALPLVAFGTLCKHRRGTTAEHDCTLVLDLAVRLRSLLRGPRDADHTGRDAHPLRGRQRVLRPFAHRL